MLIPLGHENVTARRLPLVTIGLIVANVLVFLLTYSGIERDSLRLGEVKAHILLMAAMHPELQLTPPAQEAVDNFRRDYPNDWARATSGQHEVVDGWDARMRLTDDPVVLQTELTQLCELYEELKSNSILERYAFIPAHPRPISYITSCFLHGGWLHIIGNMWFLWLAGFVLEDIWGRPLYLVFYLIAGAVAAQFFAWMNPHSTVPLVGASGAVAGLMGAFLVRFPKSKIEMGWILWIFLIFRIYRFKMPAYFLLPLWVLMEVFYGALAGSASGVAHWAHVGGFAFGAVAALLIRAVGVEKLVTRKLEDDQSNPTLLQVEEATELLATGNLDEAEALLMQFLGREPDSLEGLQLLRDVYQRRQDTPQYLDATSRLCGAHLRAGFNQAAVKEYDEFLDADGANLPAKDWLRLCRVLEERGEPRRALTEYQGLAFAHDDQPQSILALLGAARVCMMQLNRPEQALWFYQTAEASRVPHLDSETAIAQGMRAAQEALAKQTQPAATAANPQPSGT